MAHSRLSAMLEDCPPAEPVRAYKPLPSVWEGEDADLLARMLRFYPRGPARRVLDATVNAGRFWRGSKRRVIGLDLDARYRPNVVGDNMNMPFRTQSMDVVVYDPPHAIGLSSVGDPGAYAESTPLRG